MFVNDQEPYTIGPDGERLTAADLPDAHEQRWVPRKKARVVAAVTGGLITRELALQRYRLTPEEFDGWQTALARFGLRGLHVKSGRRTASGSVGWPASAASLPEDDSADRAAAIRMPAF